MQGAPTGFWGKLEARDDVVVAWHPLEAHCADVAACAEALLQRTLLRRRLAKLAGRDDLDAVTVARLCVLAALHDLGKYNQFFQNKGRVGSGTKEGHVRELMALFSAKSEARRQFERTLPLAAVHAWGDAPEGAMPLLFAAVGHHGRPAPATQPTISADPQRWAVAYGLDPFEGMRALFDATRRWFPEAYCDDGPPLPASQPFAHAFAGLVMLADWMGSDRELFPFAETDADRIACSRERASLALAEMHLDAERDRAVVPPDAFDFTAVTERPSPREAQAQTMALPVPSAQSLTLLESETGSGKTEAALMRFLHLFRAGAVDGMYFALPTRTAATQLHRRLAKQVARAFPDERFRPPVVLAVPGYLAVDDQQGRRLAPFEVIWNDDDKRRFRHRAWAAEHPKRFLAAPIAVGTIDQVLLSTLTIDHAHMRATSLLRQLLVVDEVHASDVYMTRLLEAALCFHRDAGGHALLMSATLGSTLRERLFGASRPPPLDVAENEHYPLITHREGATRTPIPIDAPGNAKDVTFRLRTIIDDPEAIAAEALAHAAAGARVLVLRNTVRAAVATQRALEALASTDEHRALLFECKGVCAPHHARFAKVDREALDDAIERDYGTASPSRGRVVVATQTVQQSLDLDADILLTDLCPMDVLLQRIGRLHRHPRSGAQRRPDGYASAVAVVLVPDDRDLARFITKKGEPKGANGFGTVYDDLRVLHATWCQIEERPCVSIPAMNRSLVERTTHPDALAAALPPRHEKWEAHRRWCEGTNAGQRRAAEFFLIKREASAPSFGESECAFPDRELGLRVSTRLGEGDRRVEFASAPMSPFGHPVRELTVPAWQLQDVAPEATVADLDAGDGRFAFSLGTKRFVYDRLGLHIDDSPPAPESR